MLITLIKMLNLNRNLSKTSNYQCFLKQLRRELSVSDCASQHCDRLLLYEGYKHTERQRQRQRSIAIHCDAPKSVPDPFQRVKMSVTMDQCTSMGSNLMPPLPLPLTLGVGTP